MTIRPMVQQDDARVSWILSRCYDLIAKPDGLTPEQHGRMIAERCQPEHVSELRARFACHVAEQNGTVVGFIAVSAGHIEELFIDPDFHRQGAATALFRTAELLGHGRVLTVDTTGYGILFYQAMGMRIAGTRTVSFGPLEGRELTRLEKIVPTT